MPSVSLRVAVACLGVLAIVLPTHAQSKARAPHTVAGEIDAHINKKLATQRIPASPTADDAEFLRRTYLLTVGRLPGSERVVGFLESTEAGKRHLVVDELLGTSLF